MQDWEEISRSFRDNFSILITLAILGFVIGGSMAIMERMGSGIAISSQTPIRSLTRTNNSTVTVTSRPEAKTKTEYKPGPERRIIITQTKHPVKTHRTSSPPTLTPLGSPYPTKSKIHKPVRKSPKAIRTNESPIATKTKIKTIFTPEVIQTEPPNLEPTTEVPETTQSNPVTQPTMDEPGVNMETEESSGSESEAPDYPGGGSATSDNGG